MSNFSFKHTFFYNAKTALTFGAHKDEVSKELYGFAFAVGIIFSPLSATLGAGIKTLIDFSRSNELPEQELEQLKTDIQGLNADKLIEGAELLRSSKEYKPHTYHDRCLMKNIAKVLDNEDKLTQLREDKKAQLNMNNDKADIQLNAFDEMAIESKFKCWQSDAIKKLLLDFLTSVINIGRKHPHSIQEAFDSIKAPLPAVEFY